MTSFWHYLLYFPLFSLFNFLDFYIFHLNFSCVFSFVFHNTFSLFSDLTFIKPPHCPISDVYELVRAPVCDHRGQFHNLFRSQDTCFIDFWPYQICQVNLSTTEIVGSIRGLHLQRHPHSEAKLIRCMRGSVWDVVVDLRSDSPTFGTWHSLHLRQHLMLSWFHPVVLMVFRFLSPLLSCFIFILALGYPNLRREYFDDPSLSIQWPLTPLCLSERDLALPFLSFFQ